VCVVADHDHLASRNTRAAKTGAHLFAFHFPWPSIKSSCTRQEKFTKQIKQLCLKTRRIFVDPSRSGPDMPAVLFVLRNMITYLGSFVTVAALCCSSNRRIASRNDKYYAVANPTQNLNDLNTYVHRKAKAWFRRFPPVNSPDRIDDDQPRGDGGVGETEDDKVDEDRAVDMADAEGSDAV